MLLRQLLLLVVCLTFCGCFPAYYTYWAPTADGGKLSNSATQIGPSDRIEFVFDGVQVKLLGGGTWVQVEVIIPRGCKMSFLSGVATLYDNSSSTMREIKFDMTSFDATKMQWLHFSATDTLLGGTSFVTEIQLGGLERGQFRIKLPVIKVNGQLYQIPEVQFTKSKGVGIISG
jgi:hypothetical protein